MNVLVLGAGGFIGSALVKQLEHEGATVLPAVRSFGDLTNIEAVERIFRLMPADLILHCADRQGTVREIAARPRDLLLENLAITVNVLTAWRTLQPQARFVALGSPLAYPTTSTVMTEELYGRTPLANPVYGLHKAILTTSLEAIKQQDGLKGTTLVLGAVYGPGDTSDRVIPSARRQMLESRTGVEMWTTGEEKRPFIYLDDQVKRILRAVEYDGAVLNVGPSVSRTVREMVRNLAETMNYSGRIQWGTEIGRNCTLDTTRFDEAYGS